MLFQEMVSVGSKRESSMHEETWNLSLNTLGIYLLILHYTFASSDFQAFSICFCSRPVVNSMLLIGAINHPDTLKCSPVQEAQRGQWSLALLCLLRLPLVYLREPRGLPAVIAAS